MPLDPTYSRYAAHSTTTCSSYRIGFRRTVWNSHRGSCRRHFTTSTKEVAMELPITIEGTKVPTEKNPKILGVTFNSIHTFKDHATRTRQKLCEKNRVLSALAGSKRQTKRQRTAHHHVLSNRTSSLKLCVPSMDASTDRYKLEETSSKPEFSAQNHNRPCEDDSTGRTNMETKIIPVKNQNNLLSQQFI